MKIETCSAFDIFDRRFLYCIHLLIRPSFLAGVSQRIADADDRRNRRCWMNSVSAKRAKTVYHKNVFRIAVSVAIIFALAGQLTDTHTHRTNEATSVNRWMSATGHIWRCRWEWRRFQCSVVIIYFCTRNHCWRSFFLFETAIIEINSAIMPFCRSKQKVPCAFSVALLVLLDGGTPFASLHTTTSK